jgi:enolase
VRKIRVKKSEARKILNSVDNLSIEVTITTEKGVFSSSVPHGTSRGRHEVKDFSGGIDKAINAVNTVIAKKLKLHTINSFDDILKFEKQTARFGGNVVLAVSFALLKSLAAERKCSPWKLFGPKKKTMPLLLDKMIGGGKHGGERTPDFQEFLILGKLEDNLALYNAIKKEFNPAGKDLEGGWALEISNKKAFDILKKFNKKGKLGCDFAASSFYEPKSKFYIYKSGEQLSKDAQIDNIINMQKEYNLYYIEDPLHEDDFDGFSKLTQKLGKKALIVGDDLLTTNPERLKRAIAHKACNGCIVKPDQIGSLTKVIEFVKLAKKNKYIPVISHRSGETDDDILADLAVGLEIPIIKIGIAGGERVAKINRLLQISKEK